MSVTAPFDPSVEQLIAQSHEQTLRVEAIAGGVTYDFDAVDWSIDWDDTRSPRVHASLEVPIPESQTILDAIDPRAFVRVRVHVGYRLPSGELDEQQVVDLGLRSRFVRRTDDAAVMTLNCASDEAIVLDFSGPNVGADEDSVQTFASFDQAVQERITSIVADGPAANPVFISTMPDNGAVDVPIAPDQWDALSDLADVHDADIYDNGDRIFRIDPRRTVAAESSLQLTVGMNGTVLSSDTGVNRDDWANFVTLAYTYTDQFGVEVLTSGTASITAGPFSVASSGMKWLLEQRRLKPGGFEARNAAARTILRRMLARSRSYRLTAVPAWWVRPGDTITLQLPLGAQERHLVSRVGFRPGAMSIETRLPDTASTIGE